MSSRPAIMRGALRSVAAAAVVATVVGAGVEWRERSAKPQLSDAQRSLDTDSRPVTFGVNGWFITVDSVAADGVGIDAPGVSDSTASDEDLPIRNETISQYDHLIHRHASAEGFDWRLVAALIFEESRFQPESESDAGAYGLMQIRPIAAESVGSRRFRAPDDNIQTGVRYLKQLEQSLSSARGLDRLALVLAAYNMGPGHLHDAQVLARRFGFDPYCWEDSMDLMLPLLEEPEFHERLASGFAKGRQTVTYVNRILERYQRYKTQAGEWPALSEGGGQAASASG